MDKGVERLIKYIRKEDVVLFIGAGFSFKAGGPTVSQIIKAIFDDAGEEFACQNKGKNLRTISENYVKDCGCRNDLITLLNKVFSFQPKDTSDQHSLYEIPHFHTIFTTNYDTLLEDAYPKNERVVITSNEGCTYADEKKVNIYKVHGDITSSNNPDGIVITESDYKNYFKNKNFTLLWETLKQAFVKKHILFIGYSLEDDDILNVIKKVRSCVGKNMKGMYLVAPNIGNRRKEQLQRNDVIYIDSTAETFLSQVKTSLMDNINDDFLHGDINKDTFDKFCKINGSLSTTATNTKCGNRIDAIHVIEGCSKKEQINLSLPNEIKDKVLGNTYDGCLKIDGTGLSVPANSINPKDLSDLEVRVNGIKFMGLNNLSNLMVGPAFKKSLYTIKIPSLGFVEKVQGVCFIEGEESHIKIDTPICVLSIVFSPKTQRDFSNLEITMNLELKEYYTNSSDALKWIECLIAFYRQENFLINNIELKPNQINKRALKNFQIIKFYYETIKKIECLPNISFGKYENYSGENLLHAMYIYSYHIRKGFESQISSQIPMTFKIDIRDKRNESIEKLKNEPFKIYMWKPLGDVKLNEQIFHIPYSSFGSKNYQQPAILRFFRRSLQTGSSYQPCR
jgi:NAD-dependent SIR2 family protein deacetylase